MQFAHGVQHAAGIQQFHHVPIDLRIGAVRKKRQRPDLHAALYGAEHPHVVTGLGKSQRGPIAMRKDDGFMRGQIFANRGDEPSAMLD